jgi:hypothetical protein
VMLEHSPAVWLEVARYAKQRLGMSRPLLKYARQALLVEQLKLPGLYVQYCCSSRA